MTGSRRDHVEATFPELAEIGDGELRERTVEAWALAMEENGVEDLSTVPWRPPDQERLDLGEEPLVDHVREVAAGGLALAELLNERRDAGIDTDTVVAGGLVHDVGKLYEFHGFEETAVGDLLGHPYYGVYVAGSVDLPPELVAITVDHAPVTNAEPAAIEAALVAGRTTPRPRRSGAGAGGTSGTPDRPTGATRRQRRAVTDSTAASSSSRTSSAPAGVGASTRTDHGSRSRTATRSASVTNGSSQSGRSSTFTPRSASLPTTEAVSSSRAPTGR